jgi:tripartite-type tricarboxylate transporter receptor subunit TctC
VSLPRRRLLQLAAGAAASATAARFAAAQVYPARPVRWIIGFAPGGTTDIISRVIVQHLGEQLGQPFVIESRPGAGTNIATESVVRAAADGYTLLFVGAPNAINASLYAKLNFNFIRDIAPVAGIMRVPNVMVVHPSVPVATVPEFIAYAKANPGRINMASSGVGSSPHLAGELFRMMAGVDIQHVPYRGATPAISDLLGGRVALFFGNIAPLVPLVREGKLRALAVTSAKRFNAVPDLPTMIESGFPGFEAVASFGLMAPAGTPQAIIDKIHLEHVKALAPPELRKRLADVGMEVIASSPAEFAAALAAERPQWERLIREAGIRSGD